MEITEKRNSRIIDGVAFWFSAALILAALAGAAYTGTWGTLPADLAHILTSPGPMMVDTFGVGSLPASFLNVGLCGLAMWAFMAGLPGPSHVNTFAGYFLVIAHSFYGLNFLNMWPCFLAAFLYLKVKKLDYNENLHVCMFATCFGPFVSELLFRYTQGEAYVQGSPALTARGVVLTVLFAVFIGFIAPAILPGAKSWHKGHHLYNGGLAYGMLAFFLFNFLYRTMGVPAPAAIVWENPVYESFGRSYQMFGNIFFLVLFAACLAIGWYLNGRSFRGLEKLVRDTGYQSNFAQKYGMPLCLINMGFYGTLFLLYVNLAVLLTDGAAFTAPTFGAVLGALTFTAMGQHFGNVWPIFLGYPLLSLIVFAFNRIFAGDAVWTVSTQAYINSAAFATGLCPVVGRYGRRAGVAAGFLCATICTSTAALHGGLMLYNSGFTAGIAAMILLPVLERFVKTPRDHMRYYLDPRDMLAVNEDAKREEQ